MVDWTSLTLVSSVWFIGYLGRFSILYRSLGIDIPRAGPIHPRAARHTRYIWVSPGRSDRPRAGPIHRLSAIWKHSRDISRQPRDNLKTTSRQPRDNLAAHMKSSIPYWRDRTPFLHIYKISKVLCVLPSCLEVVSRLSRGCLELSRGCLTRLGWRGRDPPLYKPLCWSLGSHQNFSPAPAPKSRLANKPYRSKKR